MCVTATETLAHKYTSDDIAAPLAVEVVREAPTTTATAAAITTTAAALTTTVATTTAT